MDGIHIFGNKVKNASHCYMYAVGSSGIISTDNYQISVVRSVFRDEVIICSNPDMLVTLYGGCVYIYHNSDAKYISFIPEINQLLALHSF